MLGSPDARDFDANRYNPFSGGLSSFREIEKVLTLELRGIIFRREVLSLKKESNSINIV